MATENELLNMASEFKDIVDRKDREIKVLKDRCDDADGDCRHLKDLIIEIKIYITTLQFLAQNGSPSVILNHFFEILTSKSQRQLMYVDNIRDTIDSNDLTEDFFGAFDEQI